MKKGLILINAYARLDSIMNQTARLKEEFNKLGVLIDIKRNNEFNLTVDTVNVKNEYSSYDFVIFLDKDKYVSKMIEKSGIRLFNSAKSIDLCADKMETYIALANNGFNMPKTLPGLMCLNADEDVSKTVDIIESKLSYPIIVKNSYGSLGKNVYMINNKQELLQIADELKNKPHLYQETIKESLGMDIRVIIIGGKFIGAMQRKSETDFRSNIAQGAKAYKIEILDELKTICINAAKVLGLDYCGIDILVSHNKYYICEVNSNAFFMAFENVTGINVAEAYAKYVIEEIYKN